MTPKDALLNSVKEGLASQTITAADLEAIVTSSTGVTSTDQPKILSQTAVTSKKLSIIDVLFYLAGIILYAAIMVMAFQSGADSTVLKVVITLGTGLLFWTAAYVVGTKPNQNDVRKGLVNSMMLTGSLAVASGAFFTASEVVGDNGTLQEYAAAITMAILGIIFIVFDRIFRHIILITFGVLLVVMSVPTFLTAILSTMEPSQDIWTLIGIATGVLLAAGGRFAAKTGQERISIEHSFESLAVFVILGSIYIAGIVSSIAPVWEILLPISIYAAFYVSIKRRSKHFLVTGSIFLILFLITVSFKYFSGLGAAFSLILSAASILATAFMAVNINKKYIKQNSTVSSQES